MNDDPQQAPWVTATARCRPAYVFSQLPHIIEEDIKEFMTLLAEERAGSTMILRTASRESRPTFTVSRYAAMREPEPTEDVPTVRFVQTVGVVQVTWHGGFQHPGYPEKIADLLPKWTPCLACHVAIEGFPYPLRQASRHLLEPFFFPDLHPHH